MLFPSYKKRRRQEDEWYKKRNAFHDANLRDIQERVKHIKLYQGTFAEVEKDLGRTLQRVETGNRETFLRAENAFRLCVKAYQCGADAIVHHDPGQVLGTPVRFANATAYRM